MQNPEALTQLRRNDHGDWLQQSMLANLLKKDMRDSPGWQQLTAFQQEALDMIQTKVSRILSGNSYLADHWDDIGGYALLGKGGHSYTAPAHGTEATSEVKPKTVPIDIPDFLLRG